MSKFKLFFLAIAAVTLASCSNVKTNSSIQYKYVSFAEIPSSWNFVQNDNFVLSKNVLKKENIVLTISQDTISYDDGNGKQIDLYAMAGTDVIKKVIDRKKITKPEDGTWSNEFIDGIKAEIYKPIKNFDLKGSSGKIYYLSWSDPKLPNVDFGLVILKQAEGNEELERGFDHFLKTLNLSKYAKDTQLIYRLQ